MNRCLGDICPEVVNPIYEDGDFVTYELKDYLPRAGMCIGEGRDDTRVLFSIEIPESLLDIFYPRRTEITRLNTTATLGVGKFFKCDVLTIFEPMDWENDGDYSTSLFVEFIDLGFITLIQKAWRGALHRRREARGV